MGDKSEQRKWRIGILKTAITQANSINKIVFEEKLIVEAMDKFNVSARTIKEYLNELEMKNILVRYKGEVWEKETWDKMGNILTERKLTDENGIISINPSPLKDDENNAMLEEKEKRIKDEGENNR